MSAEPPDWAETSEQRLLEAAIPLAASTGWNDSLLADAARAAGLSEGEARLVLPNGARDLASLLSRRHDQAAMQALRGIDPETLTDRDRIARAMEARLDAAAAGEATRRCAGFLTLPPNLALGLRLAWDSADSLWRWAGDAATDEHHYVKRATLAGLLIATLSVRLSDGRAAANALLVARIDNLMAFEAWSAARKPATLVRDLAGALGRLRYGRG